MRGLLFGFTYNSNQKPDGKHTHQKQAMVMGTSEGAGRRPHTFNAPTKKKKLPMWSMNKTIEGN